MSVDDGAQWRKSSRSSGAQQCVEVATNLDTPMIRDSKLGEESPILKTSQFQAFIDAVKDGKFEQ